MRSKTACAAISICVAGLAGSPVIFSSHEARAGASSTMPATCSFNSDGSGYCSGSLRAFRNSTDTTAVLAIQQYADTSANENRYFYLTWAGTTKYIWLGTGANLTATFDRIAAS